MASPTWGGRTCEKRFSNDKHEIPGQNWTLIAFLAEPAKCISSISLTHMQREPHLERDSTDEKKMLSSNFKCRWKPLLLSSLQYNYLFFRQCPEVICTAAVQRKRPPGLCVSTYGRMDGCVHTPRTYSTCMDWMREVEPWAGSQELAQPEGERVSERRRQQQFANCSGDGDGGGGANRGRTRV